MSVPDSVNADLSQFAAASIEALGWVASPAAGVDRKLLDREGGEVARATSIVRYAPGSAFEAHQHGLGEEFLVLDGVFSDEHGDYPNGAYVRNPPGSSHRPASRQGCTLFVKLRQMRSEGEPQVVVDTDALDWIATDRFGHSRKELFRADWGEWVTMERLRPGVAMELGLDGGAEILLLQGDLSDGSARYSARAWMRFPPGGRHRLDSLSGCVFWLKRGHLEGR